VKQATRSLLTLVVVGVVGAAVALVAWQQSTKEAATVGGNADELLFTIEPSDITAMDIALQGNAARLELDPKVGWKITKPVAMAADEREVTKVFRLLASARARTEFNTPERPEVPSDDLTGLSTPELTLTVFAGEQEWTLEKGAKSEYNRESYFRVKSEDGERLGTLSPSVAAGVSRTWRTFRDKRVVGAHADRLVAMEVRPRVESPESIRYAVKRLPPDPNLPAYRQTARFETVIPDVGMADASRVLLAIKSLGRAPINELVVTDHGGSLLPHGLDNPAWVVTLKVLPLRPDLAGREPFERVVRISDVDDNGTVTVARDDQPWVGRTGQVLVKDLALSADGLKSKRLFTFDRGQVARLDMQLSDAGHIVLELEEGGENNWRMLAPVPARAKAHVVTSLVLAFAELVGDQREAEGDAVKKTSILSRTGLLRPQTIVFSDKSGDQLGKLLIGKRLEEQAFVMAEGGKYIVRVPASRLDSLPLKAEELVDAR
jgi:hypothetical protein